MTRVRPAVADRAGGQRTRSARHRALDNLKVLVIMAVIAGHAIAGYSDLDFWPYAEMREVTLAQPTQIVLMTLFAPATLVLVPAMFFVAGLLTPPALTRRGTGAYVRQRLWRLGLPFAASVLVLQPLVMYPVHPPGETPASYWDEFVGAGERTLDAGPLWFVGVLLIFSLATALLPAFGMWQLAESQSAAARYDLGWQRLLRLALVVYAATVAIRLVAPLGTANPGITLNVWEWPGCAAAFGLGVAAARRGGLGAVSARTARAARGTCLTTLVSFAGLGAAMAALGEDAEVLWGGWNPFAITFAALDSLIAVFGPIWLLDLAQRHLDRSLPGIGPAVTRSAFGAFALQTPVLIGVAVAARGLPLPAEPKALLVAAASVAVAFALTRMLICWVPGAARVL